MIDTLYYRCTLRQRLVLGVGGLLFFGSGVSVGWWIQPDIAPLNQEVRLDDARYRFINPLLDYQGTDDPTLLTRDIRQLEQALTTYIDDAVQAGQIMSASLYYRDLENGPWFSVNDHLTYTPASLLKIPLMIAYFKEAEKNAAILQTPITYTTPFPDVPTHSLDGLPSRLTIGSTYTVAELIEYMIIDSDNVATILLQSQIDSAVAERVFTDFDIPLPRLTSPTDNYINARTYAGFLRILYNSTYLNQEYSERALALLAKTRFTDGLAAGIPAGVAISHKFGVAVDNSTSIRQLHDCGIIYATGIKTYALCIMTSGTDYKAMASTIKDMSHLVHTALSEL